MNRNSEYLLSLVNSAIHGRKAKNPTFEYVDWVRIHNEAGAHNLLAVIYPTVESLTGESRPPQELMEQWKLEAISFGAIQLKKNLALAHLLTEAEKRGIKMVPVKGVVLGQLYPDYLLRVSGDADVLIYPRDKEKTEELLQELGYKLDEEESIDCEQTFYLEDTLSLELHTRLWEETEGKRLDLLENMNLVSEESLMYIEACDIPLWTLGYTEHLIYLIYHMVKHFFVSGIGIRHLTDVTLYINKHYNHIDFSKVWESMDQLGYTSFCHNLFRLCITCFEMRKDVISLSEVEDDTQQWLLHDIIEAGVFGGKTNERWKAGRIMRMYYENEDKYVPRSKMHLLIEFLLPNSKELNNQRIDKVHYSKILPIAWSQRAIYLLKRWRKDKGRCSISKRVDCAADRIHLLKQLNLLK